MGEAGLPMAIGLLLEAFGPRSLPWTILVCAILQLVTYAFLHFLGSQGAGDHDEQSHIMDDDNDVYNKISLDTNDEDVEGEEGLEMVDVRV